LITEILWLQPHLEGINRHGFELLDQLRGRLSRRSVPNPAAFEWANYIKTLASHTSRRSGDSSP
jgi:hypothetical protein